MPTTVQVPGVGEIEFDDSMSAEDIQSALNQKFGTPESQGPRKSLLKADYAFAAGAARGIQDAGTGLERLATDEASPYFKEGETTPQYFSRQDASAKEYYDPKNYWPDGSRKFGGDFLTRPLKRFVAAMGGERAGKAVKEAARPYAEGAEALTQETPGYEPLARVVGGLGGMLPLLGVSAIPVVGPAAGITVGGLQSGGGTFEAAFKAYKDAGDDDDTARRKADQDALKAGLGSAAIYAALPGVGKAAADKLFLKQLELASPQVQSAVKVLSHSVQGGAVMGADALIRNAQAMQSYRPELTWKEAMEEAAQAAVEGSVGVGAIHGVTEGYQFGRGTTEGQQREQFYKDRGQQMADAFHADTSGVRIPLDVAKERVQAQRKDRTPFFSPPVDQPPSPFAEDRSEVNLTGVFGDNPGSSPPATDKSTTYAFPIRSTTTPDVGQAPGDSATLGAGIPVAPIADAQAQKSPEPAQQGANAPEVAAPAPSDYERYQQLVTALKSAPLEQRFGMSAEIEAIKNRNGGLAPKPPKPPEALDPEPTSSEPAKAGGAASGADVGEQPSAAPGQAEKPLVQSGQIPIVEQSAAVATPPPTEPAEPIVDQSVKKMEQVKAVEPPAPTSEPPDIEKLLTVDVPNVEEARQRTKAIDLRQAEIRDEHAKIATQVKEIEKLIKPQRGNAYTRSKIKASAKRSDVIKYRELQSRLNELNNQSQALDDAAKEDRRLIDSAVDAQVVTDKTQPLLRRIDRKIRMMGGDAPQALIEALQAETKKTILEKYPDATPEEIARISPEVHREMYFGSKNLFAGMNARLLDIYALRRADLEAAMSGAPTHQFPENLMARINKFTPQKRAYSGISESVENLSSKELQSLKSEIESTTSRIQAENNDAIARDAAAREAEKAKSAKMMDEAQSVADSAGKTGTVGGRTAKDVKADLVSRVKMALDEMMASNPVEIKEQEPGEFIATETKENVWSRGLVEAQPSGKFKVTAIRNGSKDSKFSVTVGSIEEAKWVVRAMASSGIGHAVVGVPGDGVYKLVRNGETMLKVWGDAKKLDVATTEGANYKTSGGAEKPPTIVKTEGDWRNAKAYHELRTEDKIQEFSTALADFARKINPEAPDLVTAKFVDDWIESKKTKSNESPKSTPQTESEPPQPEPVKPVADVPSSPMEILNTAKTVKIIGPEGATYVRIFDAKGRSTIQSIKDASKGGNPFRGVEATKIEAGNIGKDKKFIPTKGEVKIESRDAPKEPPAFQIPEGATVSAVREGQATGLEGARQLIRQSGLPPEAVSLAETLLNHPMLRKALDWDRITTEIRQQLEGNAAGLSTVTRGLLQLSGLATETTFPHEVFHFIEALLPPEMQRTLGDLRLAALRKIYGENIPEGLRTGQMTTEDFLKSGLPIEQYHLINNGEFLAEFASNRFKEDNAGNVGGWQGVRQIARQILRAVVNAVRRTFRRPPNMERVYQDILKGDWQPTPATGREYETARAQPPPNVREFNKRKTFETPGFREGTLGAYGDLATMKRKMADAIGANDKARGLAAIGNQDLLANLAAGELGVARVTLGNYDAMMARVNATGNPGLRSKVITDAFRGLGDEQKRALKLRADLATQDKLVRSKAFQVKLSRLFDQEAEKDAAADVMQTYRLQIAQSAGDVLRQMNEQTQSGAAYDELRAHHERLQQMPDFAAAVGRKVQEMVDTIAATPEGFDLLTRSGKRSGLDIYNAYVDLIESTRGHAPPGLAGMVDPAMLSPADRARVEAARGSTLNGQERAFAQLASAVLAANRDARNRLATLALLKSNPHFKAQVTAVGERFRKAYEADPNKALDQIVKAAYRVKGNAMDAEAAWLRTKKAVVPELERYAALQQAVEIDDRVQASPEWKALANRIHEDAGRERMPDSVRARATAGTLHNEFTGVQHLYSPDGTAHTIDLGYTRKTAAKAQESLRVYTEGLKRWLDDPANADSPDRKYWRRQLDFYDSALYVSTVLDPTSTVGVPGSKMLGTLKIPEFFFKSASLPQVKLTFTASNNFNRAYTLADQWFSGARDVVGYYVEKGAQSHGIDPQQDIGRYRTEVLNRLASEYRNGRVLVAGDRLNNGVVLTAEDVQAFLTMGRTTKELFDQQNNVARERVMEDKVLFDQWAENSFGLRAPQELGARPGTTLPQEFSGQAKALARTVHGLGKGDAAGLKAVLDRPEIFSEFVQRFFAERRADYSQVTPFEDIYKVLAQKWRDGDPTSPKSMDEIIDFIEANTTEEYDRNGIEAAVLGEMEDQLRKFYRNFVGPEDEGKTNDVRAVRATRDSAFTKAHSRDVGSSFFYDYGSVTAPEMRSMAMDSANFHLVRFAKSLDALEQAYLKAIDDLTLAGSETERKARQKQGMADFRAGEDFRNWDRLHSELAEVKYFKENIAAAYGRMTAPEIEVFSSLGRITGDVVSSALTGLKTSLHILFGSNIKMGMVFGGMQRSYVLTYSKGLMEMLRTMSGFHPEKVAGRLLRRAAIAAWHKSMPEFWEGLSAVTEDLYRQSKFFNEQYRYGLGFKNAVGFRVANILNQPYAHGLGYKVKFADNVAIRLAQKGFLRALSLYEAPIEVVKTVFPQLGYVWSYDVACRLAADTIDGIAANARRSFEYLEKSGQLGRFNLDHIKDPANSIPADMVIPRGLFPKTQSALNAARDWFQRATDQPLNETVLNYWKALRDTPAAERGSVSFLAADAPPEERQHTEDARAGALFAVAVKDSHHASPENRPLFLRVNKLGRFLLPLMGWSAQSARGGLQLLGRAGYDPHNSQLRLRLMAAVSFMGVMAMTQVGGEVYKTMVELLNRFIFHEVTPDKHLWEAESGKEMAKIALLNSASVYPILHDWTAALLGERSGGISIFTVEKFNDFLKYASGVIHTGDPTYGLAQLVKTELPISKVLINQLDSQQGLIARRNAEVLMRKYGPPELVRAPGAAQGFVPTPLTPYRNDLANAIFSGDADAVKRAGDDFVTKAVAMGNDPAKAQKMLQQAVVSLNPYQAVFGQKLTEDQVRELKGKLSPNELAQLQTAEGNWTAGEAALGTGQAIVKSGVRGGGGAQLGGDTALRSGGGLRTGTGGIRRGGLRNRLRAVRGGAVRAVSGAIPKALRVTRLRRPSLGRRPSQRNRVRTRRARLA